MLQNFHVLSGIPPDIMHYVLEDVSECRLHRETVDSAYTDLPFLLTPFKDNSHRFNSLFVEMAMPSMFNNVTWDPPCNCLGLHSRNGANFGDTENLYTADHKNMMMNTIARLFRTLTRL